MLIARFWIAFRARAFSSLFSCCHAFLNLTVRAILILLFSCIFRDYYITKILGCQASVALNTSTDYSEQTRHDQDSPSLDGTETKTSAHFDGRQAIRRLNSLSPFLKAFMVPCWRTIKGVAVNYDSGGFNPVFSFSFPVKVAAVDIVYHRDGEVLYL